MSDFNAAASDNKEVFKSGPFRLDLRESRLTRDGKDTGLTGKPLSLLAALMSAPQQLLTKDEIFEQVWLGRAVVDALKYRSARAAMRLQFNPALDLLKKYLKARPRDIEAWEQLSAVAVYAGDRATAAMAARRMHARSMEQGEVMSRAVTVSVMALELKQAEKIVREQLALSPENAVLNYQAQRVFLWNDNFVEAQRALEYVRSSTLDGVTIALAEIRQACAEGRIEDVPQWRAIVDEQGPLGARWQAAMLTRDHQAVRNLLEPYDTPGGLPTLMQFLFQPVFDEQQFPVLAERLKVEGISRRPAIEMPKACRLTPSFAVN